MTSLWDDDQDDGDQAITSYTAKDMADLEPDKLIAFESNTQTALIKTTSEFAETLSLCQEIVTAAYKVADYVPPFQTDKQSDFWRKKVIPILVNSLKQDIEARVEISNMFASIRDLSLVIKSNYDIVRKSKGSARAVQIAQKNIPAALDTLKQCMVRAQKLTSSAIDEFSENADEIFAIIGPEAAKFAEQKEDIDQRIRNERKKQEALYTELGQKQGEVNSTFFLIQAAEKQLSGVEVDLKASQARIDQMKKMNDDVENTIKNIPDQITKTVTEKKKGSFLFFTSSSNTTKTWQEKNKDREQDQRYYEGIIKSRMERIKANEADENAKSAAIEDLKKNLARYKETYDKASKELEHLSENFSTNLKIHENNIETLMKEKEQIEKNAIDTFEKIGLMGNTLLRCLAHVRTFAKSLQPGASAYAPLHSIMSAVKSMVESHVDLLASDLASDVFLAGTLLIEQVGFLSDYTIKAQQIMRPSEEYSIKEIEAKMKKAITF